MLTAFAVVVGTLVIQGLTLEPLLRWLDLHDDDPVGRERRHARERALQAALASTAQDDSPEGEAIRRDFRAHLSIAHGGDEAGQAARAAHHDLHRAAIAAARQAVFDMRSRGEIGDDAFHQVEEELDWIEMAGHGPAPPTGDGVMT